MAGRGDVYASLALGQVPRILGFSDREAGSATYGCFDRSFWHYRLIDFANVRYQEATHLLALLYRHGMPGNPWHRNERVRAWTEAGIRYWERLGTRAGFFSESYPHERSFVGTAFSTAASIEAARLIGVAADESVMRRAAQWLAAHDNVDTANQMAGAAVALATISATTGDPAHRQAAVRKVERLLALQDPAGYFVEYGGYDIGYLTITISYIARYLALVDDPTLAAAGRRAAAFVESKLRPDCTFEIRGTSRRTQYLYPLGLTVFAGDRFTGRHIDALARGGLINPSWLDDRFCIPLTTDYLITAIRMTNGAPAGGAERSV